MSTQRIIVSALLERVVDGERQLLVQERYKPQASPAFLHMIEIPAGGVDAFEDVYDAVRREVKEEIGLDVVRVDGEDKKRIEESIPGEKSMAFRPYLCQHMLKTKHGLAWSGFVFLCRVEGEIDHNNPEARNHRWVTLGELRELVEHKPQHIFPLQFAVLRQYLADQE